MVSQTVFHHSYHHRNNATI